MRWSNWFSRVRATPAGLRKRKGAIKRPLLGVRRATFELLEDRRLLALDYGDAPDTLSGTGADNYNTLSTDNGPNHTIVVGVKLGTNIDGDGGALQNAAANADDVNGALPDDEDGLTNPAADLVLTAGAQPRINVRATNTTGTLANLYGWIDYNANGVFDNAAERASVAVLQGSNNVIHTLVFPTVPTGFTGSTYARFRLSTDNAASTPTGAAADGEVEDYRVRITSPSDFTANTAKTRKIASGTSGAPTLANSDYFGRSVAAIGDVDGDGVNDLAVGANGDDSGGSGRGQVHILLMNNNGTVKNRHQLRSSGSGENGQYFGGSVASLGDLDGDGVPDLAVGLERSDVGGTNRGGVWIEFLNASGTEKDRRTIFTFDVGLADGDYFGRSVAAIGDLNGDGVTDLAVGAYGDDTGGSNRGALHVLFLNAQGGVNSSRKIGSTTAGGPALANSDQFGSSVASLGDLDGDGVTDLAVGAVGDDTGGNSRGAVHVLFMNADGTVKSRQKIASGVGGGPTLANGDQFGRSVAGVGDLDGDGVRDLAVGAYYDDTGGSNRGAIYLLLMNSNGTVKSSHKIASGVGGGPSLANDDRFGVSIASLGDLDGDGIIDLAVGANFDDTGGTNRGAVHMLFLDAAPTNLDPVITSPVTVSVPENTTAVMTVTATDADVPPQTVTFSIVGGADQSKFAITSGGALSFISAPNFEAPTDANGDNVYVVMVQADDGNGGADTEIISVTVTPINDNPPIFQPSSLEVNVAENTTAVTTVAATDADRPPQTLTYSILPLADHDEFSITPEGVLSFSAPPDFEQPRDTNGDNMYVVVVQASDGTSTAVLGVVVTVTPVNDNSPVFISPNSVIAGEHLTEVLTVTASDADLPPQPVTLSIVGGEDQSKFTLAASGQLSFISPPDFDAPSDANGDNIYIVQIQANDGNGRSATQTLQVNVRQSADFGDAPDATSGTGPGNYNTTGADGGPSHTIVAAIRLGANVDGDNGALQNAGASADDVNGAPPDDEDGLTNPAPDLVLTVGAQPTINVRVTNTTGAAATLYGWIDYNVNGVFENTTERASIAVPNGTAGGIVTLVFPVIQGATVGTTYARFRLSSDTAAANSTGHAADGEVEDYQVSIRRPSDGTAESAKTKKIASGINGAPVLANGDMFGSSLAALGDLDGDGVEDFAVGSPAEFGRGSSGEVHVLFMNPSGTVKSSQKITSGVGGGPVLSNGDYFGHGMAAIGDLDGDGVTDLAVGASKDDAGGYIAGAVHVLFLNPNGTVKSSQKIASGIGGGQSILGGDRFGISITSVGDLDGDGVADLAVGAAGDDTGGTYRGAVHVLLMNANGTAKASHKITSGVNGGPQLQDGDIFGVGVASLGDVDGDGFADLAVAAAGDQTGGGDRGAVYILFLNSNGHVKGSQKIASATGGGPILADSDLFGRSVAALGDLDGDGVTDLAVGAYQDDTGGSGRGAVHVLFLNSDGTVKNSRKIANDTGGGPTLRNYDNFGSAVAALGDLDGDGVTELAVGAERDDTGGNSRGAAYVLFLNRANASPIFTSPAMATVAENTTAVMTVTATDIDAPPQTVTFSIVGGADQAKFSISSGGVLSFISPPDFEAPTDADGDNVYVLMVQASDGNGGTATQTFSVTVTPVNDNSPVFTSADAVNVAENTTAVMTVTATDADIPSQPLTFSLAGGADQSKFTITTAGMLSFLAPPDFEQPTDANGDNLYVVIVEASDGSLTDLQAILVTVTNVNDLTGDYNRNGTVDAADYVIWRKTLSTNVPNGTGADGDGDGVIDEEDHGVWRENFDRTEGEEAAAAIVQGSIAAADAAADEAAPPLARSDEGGMLALSPSPAVGVTQSISSRGNSSRAALRSQFEAAASRDGALLAWETARLAVVEQSPETHATLFGTKAARSQLTEVHELADSDLSCKHFAAFDCAIESLGL